MYYPRQIVGNFFEEKVMQLFDLTCADTEKSGEVPDLVSRDGSFFVEVKGSSFNNGGVIKRNQLYKFDKHINVRRFYAFAYHSIDTHRSMQRDYPTPNRLKQALDFRSLYLFPFSIVKAYFEGNQEEENPKRDYFVKLREDVAQAIFEGDKTTWIKLGLKSSQYDRVSAHEKVHIVTRQGHLEKQILDSLRLEFV
jgi:hypothetical protein